MGWIAENWPYVLGFAYFLVSAAGQLVGMFDGPDPDEKTDKARGVFEYILGILRTLGAGTYKNEPGTVSMPLKPDSGKRVPKELQLWMKREKALY